MAGVSRSNSTGAASGIALARARAGLTQEQLAELTGVSVRTIRNLEAGETRAREGTLRALSKALTLPDDMPAVPSSPAQLPLGVIGFTGREPAVRELDAVRNGVPVAFVYGAAGIGKTALAVHWAHGAREAFPDGQLYVDLCGFGPLPPADPAVVLRRLLSALGVPSASMPGDLEELAALYRSTIAGSRILLILDNARDFQQVRQLLPGSPAAATIVTSRVVLTSLIAATNAHPVRLDPLGRDETVRLLGRRVGADRLATASGAALDSIVERCAGLPLALAIVAARITLRPDLPIDATAEELTSTAGDTLATIRRWEADLDLHAVFSWSYHELHPDAARLFRLIGRHLGRQISVTAAASLVGLPVTDTQALLEELASASLIREESPRRYAVHDLLRDYARHLSSTADSGDGTAVLRLIDHYVHTACRAAMLINPSRSGIEMPEPLRGVTLEPLHHARQAVTWFGAEISTVVSVIRHTARAKLDEACWRLGWSTVDFLDRSWRRHEWAEMQRIALRAAERLPRSAPRAHIHFCLALVYGGTGRFAEAHRHLQTSVDLFAADGDTSREARLRVTAAWLWHRQERHREALAAARQTLDITRGRGQRHELGIALNAVGWALYLLGDHDEAIGYCREAVAAERAAGTALGTAIALDSLGCVQLRQKDVGEGMENLRAAVAILDELGNDYYAAMVRSHLGDACAASGDRAAATRYWSDALSVLADVDPQEADRTRGRMNA